MKYPKYINKKDKIYLVAPSFGCTFEPYKSRLDAAIKYFQNKDYEIIEGENIRLFNHPVSSNTKEKRALEINAAFRSDAKLVASVGGGEIMCDILEYLDKDTLKNKPKWFLGYSDNTNISYLLPTMFDTASIYGINFPSFGLVKLHKEATDVLNLVSGKITSTRTYKTYQDPFIINNDTSPLEAVKTNKRTKIKLIKDKLYEESEYSFEGRLIGGCLDILTGLCGTEFDKTTDFIDKYKNENIIFFFESCDLTPPAIYRSLVQLRRAGWFKNTKDIIFGIPKTAYKQEFAGMNQYNAVTLALDDLNINYLFDLPFGHIKPTMPIINGAYAKLVFKDNCVTFNYTEIMN